MIKILALIATLFVPLAAVSAGSLSDIEGRIVEHVDQETDRALALLEESVEINSGTMNFDGVQQVGAVFRRELDQLGFQTEWVNGQAFERAGHLIGRRGEKGPKILLIGHLDTVFAKDGPFQHYRKLDEGHAQGPGTTDMKGGDVVLIQALRALDAVGVLDDLNLRVVLTGDEEKRGRPIALSTGILVEAAHWADLAIGFEDGDGDPRTAVTARRGSSTWNLEVSGMPAHSSQIFRENFGFGSIFEAARIINGFRETLSQVENLTFSPGLIVGGTEAELDTRTASGTASGVNNVIAASTRSSGDIRAISVEQREQAKRRMQAIVEEHLPGTDASITFLDSYPPMAPTEGNIRLLALYDRVSRDLGFGPVTAVDPRNAGAADISFAAGHVDMALDGIGLMGEGGHTVDEISDLTTLAMQTKRAAVLLLRLAHGQH